MDLIKVIRENGTEHIMPASNKSEIERIFFHEKKMQIIDLTDKPEAPTKAAAKADKKDKPEAPKA